MKSDGNYTIFHPQWLTTRSLQRSIKHVCSYANGTLLDIGCGNKIYYQDFVTYVAKYLSIDFPTTAKKLDLQELPDIAGDVLALPVKNAALDTVLMTQVLEHVPEPGQAIAEISRVLRKDGVLILSFPVIYWVHGEPYDFFRYTLYGIKHILKTHQLTIEKVEPQGYFWTTLGSMFASFLFYDLIPTKSCLGKIIWTISVPLMLFSFLIVNLTCAILDNFTKAERYSSNLMVIARKSPA